MFVALEYNHLLRDCVLACVRVCVCGGLEFLHLTACGFVLFLSRHNSQQNTSPDDVFVSGYVCSSVCVFVCVSVRERGVFKPL